MTPERAVHFLGSLYGFGASCAFICGNRQRHWAARVIAALLVFAAAWVSGYLVSNIHA